MFARWRIGTVVLVLVRLACSLLMPISDCDEVFNYWEPLHYLLYGQGTRTWEYSPAYGLRSYAWLHIFSVPASALRLLGVEAVLGKPAVFFGLRLIIAASVAAAEVRFAACAARKFGSEVACYLVAFLAASSGMSHAATALLPQTFTMACMMMCFSSWMSRDFLSAIRWMGVCALLGWPFSGLMALPLAIHILVVYKCKLGAAVRTAVATAVMLLLPTVLVDYYYYRKVVVAVLNIAKYNLFPSSADGSQLYGTEPWTFYALNLFLNFNGILVLAALLLFLLPVSMLCCRSPTQRFSYFSWPRFSAVALLCSPAVLWVACMTAMPHKEERFLFIVYPMVCLAGAYCTAAARQALDGGDIPATDSKDKPTGRARCSALAKVVVGAGLAGVVLVSASRTAATLLNYRAPFQVYSHLYHTAAAAAAPSASTSIKVCVGKEWYRFPSHFFLPASHRLEFVQSDFDGVLPKQYDSEPTHFAPPDFNDQNKQEMGRYVAESECDYIVDWDLPSQREPHYHTHTSNGVSWEVVYSAPFLDASASPAWTRAFYWPNRSSRLNSYRPYNLLKKKNLKP